MADQARGSPGGASGEDPPRKAVTPAQARRVLRKRRAYLLTKAERVAALYGRGNYLMEEVDVIDWLLERLA